jgi:hypothetical protein
MGRSRTRRLSAKRCPPVRDHVVIPTKFGFDFDAEGLQKTCGKEKRSIRIVNLSMMVGLCVLMVAVQSAATPQKPAAPSAGTTATTKAQQEVIELSKQKWQWMSERNLDALSALFHEDAVFVHMGGTMSRTQELDVIKSGAIQYKRAEIQDVSVKIVGTTAILLNRIRLIAVVGGNEVTNPFVVTEVYVQQDGTWKLGSLSFTRLLGE